MPFKSLSDFHRRNKLDLTRNKNDKSLNVNVPRPFKKNCSNGSIFRKNRKYFFIRDFEHQIPGPSDQRSG
jgi:hypothetical protein